MTRRQIDVVDLFAGAGGTSTGVIQAAARLGLTVNLVAINHWQLAIATHKANHLKVRHLCAKVEEVNPLEVVPSGRLRLLVASPECIHHSRARGGKPRNDQSRTSAWHVLRWLSALYVDHVLIENVPEFVNWGPLGADGQPLKSKKGETFKAFLEALRSLGYAVEYRVLNCADYGAPTTRERLFIIAARGHRKIVWPEPTHSPEGAATLFGKTRKWRTAREVIDWSTAGASIFNRKKPLVPNTLKRIFAGLEKFGGLPFALPSEGFFRGNAPRSLDQPIPTVTSRGAGALVQPFIVALRGTHASHVTSSIRSVDAPLPTVMGNTNLYVAQPFLVKFYGGHDACSLDAPLPAVTANYEHFGLAQPFLIQMEHNRGVRSIDRPLPTLTTGADSFAVVEPFLLKYNGQGGSARSIDEPVDAITTVDRFALVQVEIVVEGKPQTVKGIPIAFEDGMRGILDIRFRMLTQRELARAQSFPNDYQFLGTRKDQTKQIGNAVPPAIAEALATALLRK